MSLARDWTFSSGTLNAGAIHRHLHRRQTRPRILRRMDRALPISSSTNLSAVLFSKTRSTSTASSPTRSELSTPTPKQSPAGGNWNFITGTFTGIGSTVTFNSATQSTLTGATTFYALRDITPNTTLYFTAGSTQYVTALVDLENISLRSTTNNATWYFTYTGSNQTLLDVMVKDSNASRGTTMVSPTGTNLGNNTNWSFGVSDVGIRYWVAATVGNWNSTANWSLSSGGASGAPVPISTNTVIFDGAAGNNGACLVNTTINVATLTISGYAGTFNSQSYNITVSTAFSQNSGTVQLGTSVVTMQGDFIRSGGNFSADASTLSFTGNNFQTLTPGATGFYHVLVNKTGGTITLGGDLDVIGNFTQSAGTFATASNDITVAGNWSKTGGSFDGTASTVTFNGVGTQTLTGSTTFYDLAAHLGPHARFCGGHDAVHFRRR